MTNTIYLIQICTLRLPSVFYVSVSKFIPLKISVVSSVKQTDLTVNPSRVII